jgi:hypothetical protein
VTDQPTVDTITPDQLADLIAEAEAWRNRPALRDCLVPGCLRQFDIAATMAGKTPARPSWSGKGWSSLGPGSVYPTGGHICPDHRDLVTAHLPGRLQLPNNRWGVNCACGWTAPPQRWHRVVAALWEQHLLTEDGKLPAEPPVTDPEHRVPLDQHTEASLSELYDRLWDSETVGADLRDVARSCMLAYQATAPALGAAQAAFTALRQRMTVDSRDWSADKLDAWLYAILVGWDCENTDPAHVHNDIDCAGNEGLATVARSLGIPPEQSVRARYLRSNVVTALSVPGLAKEN